MSIIIYLGQGNRSPQIFIIYARGCLNNLCTFPYPLSASKSLDVEFVHSRLACAPYLRPLVLVSLIRLVADMKARLVGQMLASPPSCMKAARTWLWWAGGVRHISHWSTSKPSSDLEQKRPPRNRQNDAGYNECIIN